MEQFSSSLSDPDGSDTLLAAVQWLQGTLLGTVATTVAIIMVASVGLMMLSGRISYRHGVTTIFGCFVLLGAPAIVAGLTQAAPRPNVGEIQIMPSAPPLPASRAVSTIPENYDPNAGASVP